MTHALVFLLGFTLGLYSHVVIAVIRGEIWRDSGARPGDASFPKTWVEDWLDPAMDVYDDPSFREREPDFV